MLLTAASPSEASRDVSSNTLSAHTLPVAAPPFRLLTPPPSERQAGCFPGRHTRCYLSEKLK